MRAVSLTMWLLVGCAHEPAFVPVASTPRTPMPVRLSVRSLGQPDLEVLVTQTEKRALKRHEEQGHPIRGDAELGVEIEIVSVAGSLIAGVYKFCVRLLARFSSRRTPQPLPGLEGQTTPGAASQESTGNQTASGRTSA